MRVKPSPASAESLPTSLLEAASLSAMIIFIIFSVIPGSGASITDRRRTEAFGALASSHGFNTCKERRDSTHSYVYVNDIDSRLADRKGVGCTKCRGLFRRLSHLGNFG